MTLGFSGFVGGVSVLVLEEGEVDSLRNSSTTFEADGVCSEAGVVVVEKEPVLGTEADRQAAGKQKMQARFPPGARVDAKMAFLEHGAEIKKRLLGKRRYWRECWHPSVRGLLVCYAY